MLNLINKKRNKEEVKLHAQKQIEKKTILKGQIKPKEGHLLFKQEMETGIITQIEKNIEKYDIHWFDAIKGTYKSKYGKVIFEDNYRYCTALNEENARKRFNKMKQEGLTFKS